MKRNKNLVIVSLIVGTIVVFAHRALSASNQTMRQQNEAEQFSHQCTKLNTALWKCELGKTVCYVYESRFGASMSCLERE